MPVSGRLGLAVMPVTSVLLPVAERLGHLYPLKSGCGLLANSSFFRWIETASDTDAVARVTGGRAVVPAGDYVGRAMRFFGDLDPKVSWVVDAVLQPGDVALDIGANLGLVSLRMAARVGPSGYVHAFDPQPRMQSYFRRTLELNPDLPIRLHPIGLGAEDGTLTLSVPEGNAGSASLRHARPGSSQIDVPVRRLDEIAESEGIDRVDFIKLDVEGFELYVLQGGAGLIARTRPKVLVLEENDPDPETGLSPALEALQELDYDLFRLPKALWSVRLHSLESRIPCHDYVAVSRDAPVAVRRCLRLV